MVKALMLKAKQFMSSKKEDLLILFFIRDLFKKTAVCVIHIMLILRKIFYK